MIPESMSCLSDTAPRTPRGPCLRGGFSPGGARGFFGPRRAGSVLGSTAGFAFGLREADRGGRGVRLAGAGRLGR